MEKLEYKEYPATKALFEAAGALDRMYYPTAVRLLLHLWYTGQVNHIVHLDPDELMEKVGAYPGELDIIIRKFESTGYFMRVDENDNWIINYDFE